VSRRGRPANETPRVVIGVKFTLEPGPDDDIIEFLQDAPTGLRAARVIAALRGGGGMSAFADEVGGHDVDEAALAADLSNFLM